MPAESIGGVRRLPRPSIGRYAGASAGAAFVGSAAIAAVYLAKRNRLPASMAVHYGTNGAANGFAPPFDFAIAGIALDLALGAVFVGLFVLMSGIVWRSPAALRRIALPVLALGATTMAGSIPFAWSAQLLSAAGDWPWAELSPLVASIVASTGGIVAFAIVLWITERTELREPNPSPLPSPSVTARSGHGIVFHCFACGADVPASTWALLGPRIGGLGSSSYYRRCSRCGEWGWEEYLR